MVDEKKIVDALTSMKILGNEEGMIPVFGVYLTRMYADYYTKISYKFQRALQDATSEDVRNMASPLLIEAGHVCAFNTFGGIMKSEEWYGLVHPMLETKEDWVYGIVACVNALGWGIWKVEELIPDEKLVISVQHGYEAKGYTKDFGSSEIPRCYLATGGVSGIMNLIYHGDIASKPDLSEQYYLELFNAPGSFRATELKCETTGEEKCFFEAARDVEIIE